MLRCRNVFAIFLALLTGCASAPRVDLAAPLPRIRYLLTFDDGPSSASSRNSTASIADTLAQNPTQNGIKAIFFVQTRARTAGGSDTGKKLMQRLFAEGHVLGLHSGSARGHVSHRAMESSELVVSLADGMSDIAFVTGEPPSLVRPPFWAFSSVTLDAYRQSGLSMILTDISNRDGGPFLFQANPTDGGTIRNDLVRFRERLRASEVPLVDGIAPVIVTFHDTNNYTAAHLSDYLATLVSAASDVRLGMADPPYYNDRATLLAAAQTRSGDTASRRDMVPWPWNLIWAVH